MADILKKKEKNRLKGFIILCIIFIACFCLTIYLCNLYKVYDEYQKKTPVIRGTLSEINNGDLKHYLMENPTSIIYMCTSSSDSCRSFEKELKKFVKKEELTDQIIYLNLSDLGQDEFVNEFNSKYKYKNKLTSNYPAIVIFVDGKVDAMIQGSEGKKLSISKVKHFLELNGIEEGE